MSESISAGRESRAWACYDCGKCTASCPVARAGASYSPRRHVLAVGSEGDATIGGDASLGSCLTCGMCDARCPAGVAYTPLVRRMRAAAHENLPEPECPHGGAMQSLMRMMAAGETKQNRLEWLVGDLRTSQEVGEVFYWTGCSVYYDAFFSDFGVDALGGNKAAIRLLNRLGIQPVVSPGERCCGHDLLWNGYVADFERLAKHNAALVAKSGATTLVASCAECVRTLKLDYPWHNGGGRLRVLHISELLAQRMNDLKPAETDRRTITYQDPCRLGRHLGVYDAPRSVLASLPGTNLVEMGRSGKRAICCAGGTWSNCDRYAKRIQVERLHEARSTGADTLVTACPKCKIHFRCAMQDPNLGDEIRIELREIAEVVWEAVVGRAEE